MRSSGSTRNRTASAGVPLFLLLASEDRPRACTGRRLVRFGLVRPIGSAARLFPPPVLLDPRADLPLSSADWRSAQRGGLLGVDCSWNRFGARGGYPGAGDLVRIKERRRLPWLLATNPQHFGRVGELNTAEAFSAGVRILGYPEQADRLLEGFAGGEAFRRVNAKALGEFVGADGPDAIVEAERRVYGGGPSR